MRCPIASHLILILSFLIKKKTTPVSSNMSSKIEELPPSDLDEDYRSRTSQVYLGFVDAAIKESEEASIEDTFIGGEPIWLHRDSVPSIDLLKCGSCKSSENMKLLLQAFAPLDPEQVEEACTSRKLNLTTTNHISTDDDRVLYVFICTKCSRKANSIRCIRGVKKNKSKSDVNNLSEKMENVDLGKDFQINPFDLGKNTSNPFGSNPFATPAATNASSDSTSSPAASFTNPFGGNPFETKAEKEEPAQKQQQPSAKTVRKLHDAKPDRKFNKDKAFQGFFLYVEEESFSNKTPDHLKLPANLKIEKTALDLSGDDEELLEKNPVKLDPRTEKLSKFLDDDVFQKFQEIVGYNPLQVLRYELGGKPLYYAQTKKDIVDTIPAPGFNPSSSRLFEMQLMPKMIMDLEETVSLQGGMEWGTIMVFTDAENHVPKFDENGVGYVEECVRVQWEPTE